MHFLLNLVLGPNAPPTNPLTSSAFSSFNFLTILTFIFLSFCVLFFSPLLIIFKFQYYIIFNNIYIYIHIEYIIYLYLHISPRHGKLRRCHKQHDCLLQLSKSLRDLRQTCTTHTRPMHIKKLHAQRTHTHIP